MIGQKSQEYAKSHTLVLLAWLTIALATTTAAPAFA